MYTFVPSSFLSSSPSRLVSSTCSTRPRSCRCPYRPGIRSCATAPPASLYSQQLQEAAPISPTSTDALLEQLNTLFESSTSLSDSHLQQIVLHLGDTRGMSRLGLVEALGKVGSPALPFLLDGLSISPNPVVRRSCAKALAKIGNSAATQPLLHTLVHDSDTVTRSSSAGALARMGKVAIPPLLQLISDPDVSMTAKGHAAWAISFMQDGGDALFDALKHPNPDVRTAVISALGSVAIGDALPAMGGASDDDWESDKEKLDLRRRAIEGMKEGLRDEDAQVKAEAVNGLANAGCMEEIDRIVAMLSDEEAEVRRCAALALMKLGDVSVVPVLEDRVNSKEELDSVRSVAKLAAQSLKRKAEEEEWE